MFKYLNNMIEQDHRFIKKLTPSDEGLQILPVCVTNIGWHRSGAYDPQAAIFNQ
jgi:hypothetical protein